MSKKSNAQVFFHPISLGNQKVSLVYFIAKKYLHSKLPIDIITENDKAALFLDEMLWKTPSFSFIPHSLGSDPHTLIHIYPSIPPDNRARYALNLRSDVIPIDAPYTTIHEIEDNSSEERKNLSNKKYHFYKETGHKIAVIALNK